MTSHGKKRYLTKYLNMPYISTEGPVITQKQTPELDRKQERLQKARPWDDTFAGMIRLHAPKVFCGNGNLHVGTII